MNSNMGASPRAGRLRQRRRGYSLPPRQQHTLGTPPKIADKSLSSVNATMMLTPRLTSMIAFLVWKL